MRLSRRQLLAGLGSLPVIGAMPAVSAAPRLIGGEALGTFWQVAWVGEAQEETLGRAMEDVIHSVDAAMSPFRATSEISQFNSTETRDWLPFTHATCSVIREGIEIASRSEGAFDPTVGPIVGRYGFGPIRNEIASGSYRHIVVGEERVRKLQLPLTLDLCGIAKGYCVDRMAASIARLGVSDHLIELGGEVCARGRHPEGRAWYVGIEAPLPKKHAFWCIVRLDGNSIATSGDIANSYVVNGRSYSHIIDPHRREPANSDVASVSVLMPTTSAADAWATALMALGHESGPDLAERERISALFLVRDGRRLREIVTGSFADAIVAQERR